MYVYVAFSYLFYLGIVSNTYANRTSILLKVMPATSMVKRSGLTILKCETTAGEINNALFKDNPFATEVTECSECKKRIVIALPSVAVEMSQINSRLNEAIDDIFRKRTRQCSESCIGNQTTNIEISGK